MPDIILGGIGINKNHAMIKNVGGEMFIVQEASSSEGTFLNGIQLTQLEPLHHLDRIIFGMHSTFLLFIPAQAKEDDQIQDINYEKA